MIVHGAGITVTVDSERVPDILEWFSQSAIYQVEGQAFRALSYHMAQIKSRHMYVETFVMRAILTAIEAVAIIEDSNPAEQEEGESNG